MIKIKQIKKPKNKMKNKKIRQALNVSVNELRELADKLEKQHKGLNKLLKIKEIENPISKEKFLIGIINKQPKCSDTWRIENV